MDATTPDWTSLPQHLLFSIAKRLLSRIHILRFRAVCRSFRSTLPPPPKLLFPSSILTTTDFLRGPNPNGDDLFFLVESTVYAIQPLNNETSQKTWLVKVDESNPGKVQLKDPLSGLRFRNLSGKLPKSLNLLDYRVKEISKSYRLISTATFQPKYPFKVYPRRGGYVSAKTIFSTCLDESDEGFSVVAKFGRRKLSVWRNIDKKWSNLDLDLESIDHIEDIIYHNEKFYVFVSRGVTLTVDSKWLTVTEVAAPPAVSNSLSMVLLCLVKSLKDLLLIGKYGEHGDNRDRYKVFKLDEGKCEWVPVVDELELEDRVLVMDRDDSYSVSAEELVGCKGNCVIFLDDYRSNRYNYPGAGAGIFHLKDGIGGKLSDFPGYSKLFWPPPTWMKQLPVPAHN